MKKFDYYKAPPDDTFEEIKVESIKIWETYDNSHGYVDEKVNRIKDIKNVKDNAWYMVAMFDLSNQGKLFKAVSLKTQGILKEVFDEYYKDDPGLNPSTFF